MAKERSTSKIKKKWYQILAPKEFNENLIGETPSLDPRLLIGKVIRVNLMNLTRDIKKQNTNIRFKIIGLIENKAQTEVIGYQIIPAFIKRIIRRGRNNLHDSFVCETSDGKRIRLKTLIITIHKTKGAVTNSLTNSMKVNLKDYVKKISYKELIHELISYKLQINLKNSLKSIYPLRNCEIKEMILEAEKKAVGKKEEKVEVKEESNKAEVENKKEKEEKPKADKPEDKAEVKKEEAKPEEEKNKAKEENPKEKEANQDNSNKKEVKEKKENSEKTKK